MRRICRLDERFDDQPITSLVILSDNNPNFVPSSHHASLWNIVVDFRFNTVKLRDFEDRLDKLEKSPNPFARFVVAHSKTQQTHGDYETRLAWKLRIIKGLYGMGVSKDEIEELSH